MNPKLTALKREAASWRQKLNDLYGERDAMKKAGKPLSETMQDTISSHEFRVQSYEDRIETMQELFTPNGREKPVDGLQIGEPSGHVARSPAIVPQAVTAGQRWFYQCFGPPSGEQSGFSSLDELLQEYRAGIPSERLAKVMSSGMGGSGGASGGFAVPEQFVAERFASLYDIAVIWPSCRQIPMVHDTATVPAWDDSTSAAGSMFGGITAGITAESAEITESAGKMRAVKLVAKKIASFVRTSNELEADAHSTIWPSMLIDALTTVQSFELDRAVLRGDGVSGPLGLLTSDSTIVQAKEGGQAAASLVTANLAKMFSRLAPQFFRSAVWLVSPSVIPALEQLTVNHGTGGGPWAGLVRLSEAGQYSIMSRPVRVTEHCSPLGEQGDVVLASLDQFLLGMRQMITIESSRHVRFQHDETGWRSILRIDGRPMYSQPYTPREGSTMSWAVVLEDRE